jgi:pentapeptide repeat protein
MAGADVSWTSFGAANLSGADLAGAFFMPADFTKADLRGADLFGADLNSDTWTDATCPDGTSATSHGGSCVNALAFRFAGFITPKPGSTVAASAKRVIVHFKLATASGAAIPASAASAIAAAREVRVTLAGRGISATSAYCPGDSAVGEFACTIADPRGILRGKSHSYTITVAEKPGASFQTAPRLGTAANPGTIHFG